MHNATDRMSMSNTGEEVESSVLLNSVGYLGA